MISRRIVIALRSIVSNVIFPDRRSCVACTTGFQDRALAVAVPELAVAIIDIALEPLKALEACFFHLSVDLLAAGRQGVALDGGALASQRVRPVRAGAGQRAVNVADIPNAGSIEGQIGRR